MRNFEIAHIGKLRATTAVA